MIISGLSGNLADLSSQERAELEIDYVSFDNESRMKRVQRVRSEAGQEVALRFNAGFRELAEGDILVRDEAKALVVKIEPTDVIVIKPRTIREMGTVAHALGNRHMQAQFFDEDSQFGQQVMVVRYDHTVVDHLDHVGVPYGRGEHVMPRAFRHAEHTH